MVALLAIAWVVIFVLISFAVMSDTGGSVDIDVSNAAVQSPEELEAELNAAYTSAGREWIELATRVSGIGDASRWPNLGIGSDAVSQVAVKRVVKWATGSAPGWSRIHADPTANDPLDPCAHANSVLRDIYSGGEWSHLQDPYFSGDWLTDSATSAACHDFLTAHVLFDHAIGRMDELEAWVASLDSPPEDIPQGDWPDEWRGTLGRYARTMFETEGRSWATPDGLFLLLVYEGSVEHVRPAFGEVQRPAGPNGPGYTWCDDPEAPDDDPYGGDNLDAAGEKPVLLVFYPCPPPPPMCLEWQFPSEDAPPNPSPDEPSPEGPEASQSAHRIGDVEIVLISNVGDTLDLYEDVFGETPPEFGSSTATLLHEEGGEDQPEGEQAEACEPIPPPPPPQCSEVVPEDGGEASGDETTTGTSENGEEADEPEVVCVEAELVEVPLFEPEPLSVQAIDLELPQPQLGNLVWATLGPASRHEAVGLVSAALEDEDLVAIWDDQRLKPQRAELSVSLGFADNQMEDRCFYGRATSRDGECGVAVPLESQVAQLRTKYGEDVLNGDINSWSAWNSDSECPWLMAMLTIGDETCLLQEVSEDRGVPAILRVLRAFGWSNLEQTFGVAADCPALDRSDPRIVRRVEDGVAAGILGPDDPANGHWLSEVPPEFRAGLQYVHDCIYQPVILLLSWTSGWEEPLRVGSGWRPESAQVELRLKHCTAPIGADPDFDVAYDPAAVCNPLVAVPGTSMHQMGYAVDLNCTSYSTPCYAWLRQNAPKLGLCDSVPNEPWHWQTHTGACISGRGG